MEVQASPEPWQRKVRMGTRPSRRVSWMQRKLKRSERMQQKRLLVEISLRVAELEDQKLDPERHPILEINQQEQCKHRQTGEIHMEDAPPEMWLEVVVRLEDLEEVDHRGCIGSDREIR